MDNFKGRVFVVFKRKYSRDEISLGDITINKASRTVCKNGVPIEMTSKELELLTLFLENPGKTLTKEYLFSEIWGGYS